MPKQILWLDNDPDYLEPYVETLTDEGFQVTVASTITEAEKALRESRFDLMLLDVMIPTVSAEEEKAYLPQVTDLGNKTGLLFYRNYKELFRKAKTHVLVMTVRLDKPIMDEFIKAGLPSDRFATKYDLRDVGVFLEKVQFILGEPLPAAA